MVTMTRMFTSANRKIRFVNCVIFIKFLSVGLARVVVQDSNNNSAGQLQAVSPIRVNIALPLPIAKWRRMTEHFSPGSKSTECSSLLSGGVCGVLHGLSLVTFDLDVCCSFSFENLHRLEDEVRDLHPFHRFGASNKLREASVPKSRLTNSCDFRPSTCSGWEDFLDYKNSYQSGTCRSIRLLF